MKKCGGASLQFRVTRIIGLTDRQGHTRAQQSNHLVLERSSIVVAALVVGYRVYLVALVGNVVSRGTQAVVGSGWQAVVVFLLNSYWHS